MQNDSIMSEMFYIALVTSLLIMCCIGFPFRSNDIISNNFSTDSINYEMLQNGNNSSERTERNRLSTDSGLLEFDNTQTRTKDFVNYALGMANILRNFTENVIRFAMNTFTSDKRAMHANGTEKRDFSLNDIKQNQGLLTLKEMINTANVHSSVETSKLLNFHGVLSNDKPLAQIDISPSGSSLGRQWTNSYPHFRSRRSLFSDLFGLVGNKKDTEEVVFGTHMSPCEHADRHYCFNGGTCFFLEALSIKTCWCKIGYTGLRCQMINQEYLLALLSDEFFS